MHVHNVFKIAATYDANDFMDKTLNVSVHRFSKVFGYS